MQRRRLLAEGRDDADVPRADLRAVYGTLGQQRLDELRHLERLGRVEVGGRVVLVALKTLEAWSGHAHVQWAAGAEKALDAYWAGGVSMHGYMTDSLEACACTTTCLVG